MQRRTSIASSRSGFGLVCSHLLCRVKRFCRLAHHERPRGRLLAFVPGNLAACIRPLQTDIRFFHIPIPALPTAFLTVHQSFPGATRAYPVPHIFPSGADPSFTPVVVCPREVIGKDLHLTTPLLVQVRKHFCLVWHDDACQWFAYVGGIRSSLTRRHSSAGRVRLPSRFDVPNQSDGTLP